MEYERSKKHLSDYAAALEYASEEGMERGMAKGIAIGREDGIAIGKEESALLAARRMKAKGFNTAVICEITGLSEGEIGEL